MPDPKAPAPTPRAATAKSLPGEHRAALLGNPTPPARPPSTRIKVRAKAMGYYRDMIRRPGDVFVIDGEAAFSTKWMERAPSGSPLQVTNSNAHLRREHDEIMGARLTPGPIGDQVEDLADGSVTGDADPLGGDYAAD